LLVDARRGYSPLAAWRSRGVCFILIFTSTGAPLLHFYCESAHYFDKRQELNVKSHQKGAKVQTAKGKRK
jgi:hypothetical protein